VQAACLTLGRLLLSGTSARCSCLSPFGLLVRLLCVTDRSRLRTSGRLCFLLAALLSDLRLMLKLSEEPAPTCHGTPYDSRRFSTAVVSGQRR